MLFSTKKSQKVPPKMKKSQKYWTLMKSFAIMKFVIFIVS